VKVSEYLEAIGVAEAENIGMLWIKGDKKKTAVVPRNAVESYAEQISDTFNAYLAPNPTAGPTRFDDGRGTEEQVTRVAAVYADLDVKLGACKDIEAAWKITADISARIGERPTVVIFSGGGLQPIWALDDCSPAVGIPLLRRFGRLVRAIGQADGIKLDSVFDAARVLRIPGSLNHKYGDPVECSAIPDTGGPVDPATLAERLDEWGIFEETGDDKTGLGDVVEVEGGWRYAAATCGYAHTTIKAWLEESVTERHPWLLGNLVRLECMRRNGCLSITDYQAASRQLEARFHHLLATGSPKREAKRYEVAELHNVAVDRASRKSAAELDTELGGKGGHVHLVGAPLSPTPAPMPASPAEAPCAPGIANLVELEQDFWTGGRDKRESLGIIFTAALARTCSPWAVLACCVARALATVPPNVTLPELVGGKGTLNWFGAIAAPSGGGKGSAMAVARDLITQDVYVRNLGSGEGMVQSFKTTEIVTVIDAQGNEREQRVDATRESIMFNADEVDSMAALGARSGSTLMQTLRSAFSGERLGFSYAASGKEYHVEPHTYRMTFLCSVQPGRARALLGDGGGGTPQRFMWFPGIDGRISRESWEQNRWMPQGLALPTPGEWQYPREVILPTEATNEILDQRFASMRGDVDALDGHSMFAREKFAYALAVLDERVEMTSEDWRLSGIAAAVSSATRDWVGESMSEVERDQARQEGEIFGHRNQAARETEATGVQERRDKAAGWVLRKLAEAGPEGVGYRELTQSAKSGPKGHRPYLADVLAQLTSDGAVVDDTGHRGKRTLRLGTV